MKVVAMDKAINDPGRDKDRQNTWQFNFFDFFSFLPCSLYGFHGHGRRWVPSAGTYQSADGSTKFWNPSASQLFP